MVSVTLREDDYSVQATSDRDDRLFVRYDKLKSTQSKLVLSDVLISQERADLGLEALQAIAGHVHEIESVNVIWCTNILPSYASGGNRTELVRRHDEIRGLISDFAQALGRTLENAYLTPDGKGYATEVRLEPMGLGA